MAQPMGSAQFLTQESEKEQQIQQENNLTHSYFYSEFFSDLILQLNYCVLFFFTNLFQKIFIMNLLSGKFYARF